VIARKLTFGGMSLQFRITATIGLVALVACSFVGAYAYMSARSALIEATRDRLSLAAENRVSVLQSELDATSRGIETLADNALMRYAFVELTDAYRQNETERRQYIDYFTSPSSVEGRIKLEGQGQSGLYGWRHDSVHTSLRGVMSERGYADILLITNKGEVVYSVGKYADFGKNVNDESLRGTSLARVFKSAIDHFDPQTLLLDFEPYAPAGNQPSAFIARSVWLPQGFGDVDGILVFRITSGSIDASIGSRNGLGETGESYVIGSDGVLRSQRPLSGADSTLTPLGRPAVVEAQEGPFTYVDETGTERFAEKQAVSWHGHDFYIVTDQTADEALRKVVATGQGVIFGTVTMLVLALAFAFLMGRSIVRPIRGLTGALHLLVKDSNIPHIVGEDRRDEIGDIARAVVDIRDRVQMDAAERQRETERAQRREAEARKEMMNALADDLEAAVGEAVATLGREAQDLSKAAHAMATLSDEARGGSDRVANAATTASNSVQDVAASTEQLSTAIVEISQLIARSAAVTNETNEFAANTSGVVLSLNECANRIGEIVTLIENIANQTNLLALNATIEAARAGDAGKGFAVVAAEVKGLATQTAKATEEIGRQIDEMRAATNTAVGAVGAIQSKVGEISSAMTSVAAAVEEQSAATQTIATSADVARGGAASVSDDIAGVRSVIVSADEAADVVVRTAAELQKQAASVDERVRSFLQQIKAA
jgi:methyl-accepting chemotaxis protein